MDHKFNVYIAEKYGMAEAVLLEGISFWCLSNKANGRNIKDGLAYTFNSIKALHDLYPYLSEKKIRNALSRLENEGVIVSGCFNKNAYDRTKWYAVTEKGFAEMGNSICPKRQMTNAQKGEPIPFDSPVNSKDKDGSSAKASSPSQKEALDYEAWSKAYSENAKSLPGIRLMSDKRKAAVRSMISQGISISDFSEACRMASESDFLTGGGKSGWKANPDWMFNATNVLKVLEGNYSPRKGNNQEAGVISIIDDETRRFLEAM